jgi:hypothetical protein
VSGDGGRIGLWLDGDQFQIRSIGKTGKRHFGGMIRMRAAVFAGQAGALKRSLHGAQVLAGDGDMVHFELFGYDGQAGEQHNENRSVHAVIILAEL